MAERIVETALTGREVKEILRQDYALALERSGIGDSELYDFAGHNLMDSIRLSNRSGFGKVDTLAWASRGEAERYTLHQVEEAREFRTPTEERVEHDMDVTLEHTVTRQRRKGKAKKIVAEDSGEERP